MEELNRMQATALRQRGLVSVPQLRALGFDRAAVRVLASQGRLTAVRRGLYRLGGERPQALSWEDEVAAACMHPAQPAASGLTAAHIWGLWQQPRRVEVAVRYPLDPRIPGVEVHRSADLRKSHVTTSDGLRMTTPTRTLVDLGRLLPEEQVAHVLDHAMTSGLVDRGRLTQIRIEVGEHGRNGAGVLGRLLDAMPAAIGSHGSGRELAVRRLLLAAGLPDPAAQIPVRARGRRYYLDLGYPEARVAIEYDGEAWHSSDIQLARDACRQADCESIGWTFVRIRKADMEGVARYALLAKIRMALQHAGPDAAA